MASIKKSQAKKTKVKKARLGRGLDALLGGSIGREDVSAQDGSESSADRLESLPVEWLQRGEYQPRTNMGEEALQDLAASISTQGIVQPILVRELAPRKYEIIATCMNVTMFAKVLIREDNTLRMPAGTTFAPWRIPLRLAWLGCLPKSEVEGILFLGRCFDARARFLLFQFAS